MKPKNIRGLRIKHVIWIFALPPKIAREEIKIVRMKHWLPTAFIASILARCIVAFALSNVHSHTLTHKFSSIYLNFFWFFASLAFHSDCSMVLRFYGGFIVMNHCQCIFAFLYVHTICSVKLSLLEYMNI